MHAPSPHDSGFGLVVERSAGAVVVAVSGDLDLFSAPDVRERLVAEANGGATRTVVDLERCTFVDSAGTAAILTASRRCRALGCELVVAAPLLPHRLSARGCRSASAGHSALRRARSGRADARPPDAGRSARGRGR